MDEVTPVITAPIRVLLVDDHEVSREGLAFGMERHADLLLVGEATSGAEALARVRALEGAVDVVVMDVQMASPTDGIDTTARLHAEYPECRVLLLTSSPHFASAAWRAGATGYVLKGTHVRNILVGIRAVHRGVMHFEVAPEAGVVLTDAEVRILDLIGESLSNAEIGQRLGWSSRAVTAHVSSILRKLGAAGREQAVRLAMRQGIIH